MKKANIYILLIGLFYGMPGMAKDYSLQSPSENIRLTVIVEDDISIKAIAEGKNIIEISSIQMQLKDLVLGEKPRVRRNTTTSVNELVTPLYGINKTIKDEYNELTLEFKKNFTLHIRAYNQGFAYRFGTSFNEEIVVVDEKASYDFYGDVTVIQLGREDDWHGYETAYQFTKLSEADGIRKKCLPFGFRADGYSCTISESGLLDYPGMYLQKDNELSLEAVFPKYPTKVEQDKERGFNLEVKETADFIAKTEGNRTFPWRVVTINTRDIDMLNNEMVYLLAPESKIGDTSWVKPGKVAWDWWNANNMHGVDFKTGFNTETYKYYIDFAAANNIRYVNLDEGWSDQFDLLDITDKLDMEEVVRYAHEKNIGLILWCVWHTIDRQMQEALNLFEKWGIAGVKVDFMDRDDQVAVQFYERLLKETAKREIFVNYHGAYKPTGLRRAYPNLINREAVMGLEFSKWSADITPEHDVTIPFLRMLAGPMDFTPGAMINAVQNNFCARHTKPMSQGTRCHQLAMFVAYFAPLQMLCDAPTNYQADPKILAYLADIPTSWDETKVIDGQIGDYLVIARRKGKTWYVAAMTDWTKRSLDIDLSFIGNSEKNATIFADGINADRNAIDYTLNEKRISLSRPVSIQLAPGGGWVGVFTE